MRRRQVFAQQNNRAPVPSGAGVGAAAVTPPPSPVSREEEEAKAPIWTVSRTWHDGGGVDTEEKDGKIHVYLGGLPKTPATDPQSNLPRKKGGWPKGKKRGPRK